MDYFSLVHLIALFHSVVAPLTAPVNVSVFSVNFRHILRWDPGPGTPPGTVYTIFSRVSGRQRKQVQNTTDGTSLKLKLSKEKKYYLTVQAVFNKTFSPESRNLTFIPYEQTKIGPPQLSLAGCSNCIHVNITLPEADSHAKIRDMQKYYDPEFRVLWWKKRKEKEREAVKSIQTQNKSFTLPNLESGVEYCVQVHVNIRINKNTEPSAEYCSFTSHHEETRIAPVVIGAVAVPLIVVAISMLCLHHSGFLCKVKAALPRDLIAVLSHGYVLTPEKTIPDQLSICSEMGKNRKHNPTTLPSAKHETNSEGEDEDEDEEDEMQVYLDRAGELSSDERSHQGSGNTSGNSNIAASHFSGSFTEKLSAKVETLHAEFDQDEVKAEETEVSFMHKGSGLGFQRQVVNEFEELEEEEDEEMNMSGDVNLFSVTLGALAASEEEEEEEEEETEQNTEDSLPDLLTLSSQEHKLVLDSSLDLSHADTQTGSYYQTGRLSHTTHKDYCDWR